jgi:hypothetical protein
MKYTFPEEYKRTYVDRMRKFSSIYYGVTTLLILGIITYAWYPFTHPLFYILTLALTLVMYIAWRYSIKKAKSTASTVYEYKEGLLTIKANGHTKRVINRRDMMRLRKIQNGYKIETHSDPAYILEGVSHLDNLIIDLNIKTV